MIFPAGSVEECNLVDNRLYAAYFYSPSDEFTVVNAVNNWWGCHDSSLIENMIYHHQDNITCPTINFMPFADAPFDITDTGSTAIAEPEPNLLPEEFTLYQNFPNPFNASTSIRFEVPRSGNITLAVYNMIGQKTAVLADGYYRAGIYQIEWDGRDSRGREVASGVYFYGLTADDTSRFNKMILLK